MPQVEVGRFTVGVFQDVAWAQRGLEALRRHQFPVESLTVLGRDVDEVATLVQTVLGTPGRRFDLRGVGPVVAHGPLLADLDTTDGDLARLGLAATMGRVGYQTHDAFIFETLTARGGILVAIRSEPRAADALALLHAYGGGNAAIGAWTGRL